MPRYEFVEGSSSKFWEIKLLGKSFTTTFGKIGSAGQTKLKEYRDAANAKAEYDKLIAEKTKKGYALAGATAKPTAAAGKAPAAKPSAAKASAAKPPAKPAHPPASAGQYFELVAGGSSKFWEITLAGTAYTVRFGKIGTAGQTSAKSFKSAGEARAEHDKLVGEKTKKGYRLVRGEAPAGPTIKHACDAKLEAAIAADPDDPDAYLVYADWLQGEGDPRGELIVLQHANKTAAATKQLQQNKEHFFGKLADAQDLLERFEYGPLGRATTWRWGYLEALWISNKRERSSDHDGELPAIDVDEALGWLLDHPSCRFLRELTVGINAYESNSYAGTAAAIGRRKLPTLRKLILGDFYYEETELNWSHIGGLEPMYKALPNLESLTLRSGGVQLSKIDLPRLRELRVISGGFDPKSLAAICAAKWPHLETLNLQLGSDEKWTVKHLTDLFSGRPFPKLTYLGLGNATITDDICRAIVGTKLAGQLETLDLTKGTMGDDGAAALAAGKFPRLQRLLVAENYLTKKGLAALKGVAKIVDTKAEGRGRNREDQRDDGGDPEDRYIAAHE